MGVMSLREVRVELDRLTPSIVNETHNKYDKEVPEEERNYCTHPEKTANLVIQTKSFEERMWLIEHVTLNKKKELDYIENMMQLRIIPRELDVINGFIKAAEDIGWCWKIGRDMGKCVIFIATEYQFERLTGKASSVDDFKYDFNLGNFNSFYNMPEFGELIHRL